MREALVCLSGGVDSTAAMLICHEEWDSVRALYLDTGGGGPPPQALGSTARLGVDLLVLDAAELFRLAVKRPSEEACENGFTPNPCVKCNASVKLASAFPMLRPGETIVTGHYARLHGSSLMRAVDTGKDQSYFLSMVPQPVLSRCAFPLGGMMKAETRELVARSGLPCMGRESQDLCFRLEAAGEPGEIVTVDGETVGRHQGIGKFTIGQRRGIGAHGRPMYVTRLEVWTNRVYVGEARHLLSRACTVCGINDLGLPVADEFDALVQVRSRHRAAPAIVRHENDGLAVRFHKPQRAVAPGQTAVFYSDSEEGRVLGAGVIVGTEG